MVTSGRPLAFLLGMTLVGTACIHPRADVPYVQTPHEVVAEMLRVAGVGRNDVVYDLGSGDGRLVIAAARDFGARGVGVEIDPRLVAQSAASARRAGVADRVTFREQDLFQTDLADATVVTLYLSPELNLRLRPKLLRELRPGSRIVSHDFDMGDWPPARTLRVHVRERASQVYLWVVPNS
jgi:SAM-dependent methyltransferase